jgi:hypothetical protein
VLKVKHRPGVQSLGFLPEPGAEPIRQEPAFLGGFEGEIQMCPDSFFGPKLQPQQIEIPLDHHDCVREIVDHPAVLFLPIVR